MTYRFWIDTETTGLKPDLNQILEYAVVVEDEKGNKVEELEVRLLLRPFVRPSPEALAANNIDPYSQDWINSAIQEEKAADKLADLCEKYTVDGIKPVFVAYNAHFDVEHIRLMFKRHGTIFENCFTQIFDPLKAVKELVKSGKLITRRITSGKKSYNSSKLTDVSDALKVTTGKPAHRALNDVETLILVTREVYTLVTGKSLYEASCSPERYSVGEVLNLVTDSPSSGLKNRHIKIIRNETESKKFVAFDLSDYERIGLAPSNIRTFNYSTVMDELTLDQSLAKKVHELFESNLDYISEKSNKPIA